MGFSELLAGEAYTAVRADDHARSVRVVGVAAVIGVLSMVDESGFAGEAVEPVSDTGNDVRLGLSVLLESSNLVD